MNFHKKPGGDTAGLANTNWPNRTGYSVPCAIMLGSGGGGELAGGKSIAARERMGHWAVRVALSISLFVLYILLISITVVTVHFICCFC